MTGLEVNMATLDDLDKVLEKFPKELLGKIYMESVNIVEGTKFKYPRISDLTNWQRYARGAKETKKWKRSEATFPVAGMMSKSKIRTKKGSKKTVGWLVSNFSENQEMTAFIRSEGHQLIQGYGKITGRRGSIHVFPKVDEGQWSSGSQQAVNKLLAYLNSLEGKL